MIGSRDGFRSSPGNRCGLAYRVAEAHREPRAHGARRRIGRRARARRARGGARTMAERGRARQSRGLAHGHRQAPRDRSAAPPKDARPQARGDRARSRRAPGSGRRRSRDRHGRRRRRRFASADLHGVPSDPSDRGAPRAHASSARRPHDRGNCARLSRLRTDHRAAHRPRQTNAGQSARAVRGASRRRTRIAPGLRSRSHLSDLQRRVHRDTWRRLDAPGALRRRASARTRRRRARARRAGGARSRRAARTAGIAFWRESRRRRIARASARSESWAMGSAAAEARTSGARSGEPAGR